MVLTVESSAGGRSVSFLGHCWASQMVQVPKRVRTSLRRRGPGDESTISTGSVTNLFRSGVNKESMSLPVSVEPSELRIISTWEMVLVSSA